jgi:hypothetical protein
MGAVRQKCLGDLLACLHKGFPGTIILLGAFAVKLNPEILDVFTLELGKDGTRFEILTVCHCYSLPDTGSARIVIVPLVQE